MPSSTWDRLPAARRDAVIAAAEREFADQGFSRGSLNVIARNAGVSKGSLFQYFEDKVDLFVHVAGLASARIRDHMQAAASALPWDTRFFPALRMLNEEWVRYFFGHPVDLALTAAANLEPDRSARPAVRAAAAHEYESMLRPLIQLAAQSGQLVAGADEDALLAHLLLLLPHLALAPHVEGLDSVLGLEGAGVDRAIVGADRLLRALETAYARS